MYMLYFKGTPNLNTHTNIYKLYIECIYDKFIQGHVYMYVCMCICVLLIYIVKYFNLVDILFKDMPYLIACHHLITYMQSIQTHGYEFRTLGVQRHLQSREAHRTQFMRRISVYTMLTIQFICLQRWEHSSCRQLKQQQRRKKFRSDYFGIFNMSLICHRPTNPSHLPYAICAVCRRALCFVPVDSFIIKRNRSSILFPLCL